MGPLFLSLVNGTIVVLLGLTESLVLLHQFSSLFNALSYCYPPVSCRLLWLPQDL